MSKVECPCCGREVKLTKAGNLYMHKPSWAVGGIFPSSTWCEGSKQNYQMLMAEIQEEEIQEEEIQQEEIQQEEIQQEEIQEEEIQQEEIQQEEIQADQETETQEDSESSFLLSRRTKNESINKERFNEKTNKTSFKRKKIYSWRSRQSNGIYSNSSILSLKQKTPWKHSVFLDSLCDSKQYDRFNFYYKRLQGVH